MLIWDMCIIRQIKRILSLQDTLFIDGRGNDARYPNPYRDEIYDILRIPQSIILNLRLYSPPPIPGDSRATLATLIHSNKMSKCQMIMRGR